MDMRCPGACCQHKAIAWKGDFSCRGSRSGEACNADAFEGARGTTRNRDSVSRMVKMYATGEAGLEKKLTKAERVDLCGTFPTTDDVQPSFPFEPGRPSVALFLVFGARRGHTSAGAI